MASGRVPVKVNIADPDFEAKMNRMSDSLDSDVEISDEGEEDIVEESEHDTDSEIEVDWEQEIRNNRSDNTSEGSTSTDDDDDLPNYYYGKNRFKWSRAEPSRKIRTSAHNIVRLPTIRIPQIEGEDFEPLTAWELIFDESMLQSILTWTNQKLQQIRTKYSNPNRTELRDLILIELKCFLGLLCYSAVFKSNHEDISSLFATDGTGREVFRMALSERRFSVILNCLRFDDILNRDERKVTDAVAAISDTLAKFNKNSQAAYTIGANATIDEMLVAFRGRCGFKMYMPSKPAKYGLKMQRLADARTCYVYNTYLYCGKGCDGMYLSEDEKKYNIPTQAVLRLCKPIFGTNRNITTDNWYTSIELANVLKNKQLTLVGTLKKNKREIPKDFLPSIKRPVDSCLFGFFTRDVTMVSYAPKKNKAVVLISTMHHTKEVDKDTKKPEIVLYYNNTKGGVDTVDQKCSNYSTSRFTRRWPMVIFHRILDMSFLNAFIIHQSRRNITSTVTRLQFMKALAKQLIQPYMNNRLYSGKLPYELRSSIARALGQEVSNTTHEDDKLSRNERKTCYICPAKKRRKTAYLCCNCKRPICLECSKKMCNNCIQQRE